MGPLFDAFWRAPGPALLARLAAEAAPAFLGREVSFDAGGRPLRARLESIGLTGRGGRVELRGVDWDGLEVEVLSAVAAAVTVDLAPGRMALVATGIELHGHAHLVSVVAWLDRSSPEWELRAADSLIEARRRAGSRSFLIDATIRDHELVAEVRAVRWRRMTLPVPRRLRPARRRRLPEHPSGATILEATRTGAHVEFRLAMPSHTQVINPRW